MDHNMVNPFLEQVISSLKNVKVNYSWAHSQENINSYKMVYSNLEEDSLYNLQKFTKHGWFRGKESKRHQ